MTQAIERGADAFFDEKYGRDRADRARPGYSFELCGGTHAPGVRPDRVVRHHR